MNQKNPKQPMKQRLLQKAFNYLKVRDRTEHELRQKLAETEASPEEIDAAIHDLGEMGFIDDESFAEKFSRSRLQLKHQGPVRIRLELKRLGVKDEIVKDALQELSLADQVQAATAYLASREWRLRKYDKRHQKLKAKQLLFSRGFNTEIITLAIDEIFAQE